MSLLAEATTRLDGRPYPAYRDIGRRSWAVDAGMLVLEHVQGDPFAAPSRLRLDLPAGAVPLPAAALASAVARRATADFFQRALANRLTAPLAIARPGAAVLERTGVTVAEDGAVVVRLTVGLPATGRRIRGREASTVLTESLPSAAYDAIVMHDGAALMAHVAVVEDQVALRAALAAHGLVAFLADGSILPRRSGVDESPLPDAIALVAPDTLAVTLTAPHAGVLRGLAIPTGVTLVVGGGYHGKSTLLDAIAHGVYDHPPGDGRERCVTTDDAVSVRAEDGRSVRAVDLRPFIGHLPLGRSTQRFDTDDASGSTSQAAAIVEALEAGARSLLVDEDTAASNFMVRDARMRRLIPAEHEPITPFVDRVRQLHADHGVSSVLVVGGAGDWLDVADTIVQMRDHRPVDARGQARAVVAALPLGDAAPHAPGPWPTRAPRVPDPSSLDAVGSGRRERVRAHRMHTIVFGDDEIDVSLLAQLVEPTQCRFIGDALLALSREPVGGTRTVATLLDLLDARGLDALAAPTFGDRARARRFEIAAALNRLRTLRCRPSGDT
ncbi:MAG TPA: ABC-ATPase domain-containing protein [Candidatus Binatia bacterium]|jgi:predicted ABC-class ATPase|nr:ABC-ATPase domain-containing protein [Candidatus Binatia bacterium]